MTGWLWAGASLAAAVVLAAVGDLISEEIRGWLDLAPHAILRLAAVQLNVAQRETIYQDEWLPELTYALRGAEARPITRLIIGIRYATGMLIAARRIGRRLNRGSQSTTSGSSSGTNPAVVIMNISNRTIGLKSHQGVRIKPGTGLRVYHLDDATLDECAVKGLALRFVDDLRDSANGGPPPSQQTA